MLLLRVLVLTLLTSCGSPVTAGATIAASSDVLFQKLNAAIPSGKRAGVLAVLSGYNFTQIDTALRQIAPAGDSFVDGLALPPEPTPAVLAANLAAMDQAYGNLGNLLSLAKATPLQLSASDVQLAVSGIAAGHKPADAAQYAQRLAVSIYATVAALYQAAPSLGAESTAAKALSLTMLPSYRNVGSCIRAWQTNNQSMEEERTVDIASGGEANLGRSYFVYGPLEILQHGSGSYAVYHPGGSETVTRGTSLANIASRLLAASAASPAPVEVTGQVSGSCRFLDRDDNHIFSSTILPAPD